MSMQGTPIGQSNRRHGEHERPFHNAMSRVPPMCHSRGSVDPNTVTVGVRTHTAKLRLFSTPTISTAIH